MNSIENKGFILTSSHPEVASEPSGDAIPQDAFGLDGDSSSVVAMDEAFEDMSDAASAINITSTCRAISEKESGKSSEPKPYRLGIALSGGGARGFAHAGVLKALDEVGLKPDVIAGVSAGAVAGTLYAAGIAPQDILTLFNGLKFKDLCKLSIPEGEGLFQLTKFKRQIEKWTGVKNLEDLKTPMYIGATDFDRGVPAEFHEGPLGERVIASCSIPIVFRPVKINGVNYVDGGVLRNLPAWIIREKCDILIGVNVSPLPGTRYKHTIMDAALRTYNIMLKKNHVADAAMCDFVIKTPELAHYQVFNLKDINKVFLSGYAAAHRAIKEILASRPDLQH